ncbi:MAG: cobyric acid synthase [Prevotellaceae bacterium]|jgi:adenosylcobyric acid synthase|nr:cobyric acid synthase [Prevotellaceae bacterium]
MSDKSGTKEQLRPIMFAGTGSDVGKSVIASAFCRIFLQDGYNPAPFKAQNMSLNSYATPEGFEIGRAQAVQAEAAGIACHTDMNPILLKPSGDRVCQVVLNGKPAGNRDAYDYFKKEGREILRGEVNAAFDRLRRRYSPIVMEGAGSIAEINLRETDLVNMPMALHAGASVVLVADIDRGGVFASVYGSLMLLDATERKHVKGIIINKFRGDIRLFESGVEMLETLCGIPVIGVIPYFRDIHIEEEDSVALGAKNRGGTRGKVNVAAVLLRHLSNFTDFNVLERDPRVHLYYTNNTDELEKADIIVIPGTKNTLSDLHELRRNGVARSIVAARRAGATVIGICGGYQMMGLEVRDPERIEGDAELLPGLGLLPVVTVIGREKLTRQVRFSFLDSQSQCAGYEIHMGTTSPADGAAFSRFSPLNRLDDGTFDGCFIDERCFGTYIHGILDNAAVVDYLLSSCRNGATNNATDNAINGTTDNRPFDYATFREEQYDKLAAHVRKHVNMNLIYKMIKP